MHLRIFDVAKQVPIGNGSSDLRTGVPESDKADFDVWLRELWACKDQFMTEFLKGDVSQDCKLEPIEIPLELHSKKEMAVAYCFFAPVAAIYALNKLATVFA